MIFSFLMQIAAFELLPTDEIYEALFGADIPAEAFNDRFEIFGLEHWLLMNNLGTFGCILLFSPVLYLLSHLIGWCKAFKVCRQAKKKLELKLFWGYLLRMMIESYMITFICCLLNILQLDFSTGSGWVLANSIITVLTMPFLALFPVFSICYMYSSW